jgi:flagellar biogenesis protein FliO
MIIKLFILILLVLVTIYTYKVSNKVKSENFTPQRYIKNLWGVLFFVKKAF